MLLFVDTRDKCMTKEFLVKASGKRDMLNKYLCLLCCALWSLSASAKEPAENSHKKKKKKKKT